MSEPITKAVEELAADINWTEITSHMSTKAGAILDGDWLDAWHDAMTHACDAIGAVHYRLERENESLKVELDRVLGEQEPHHIGSATVTVTPRLDWSGVAGELRAIADALGRTPAPPEVVSDGDTDGATGYCRCGACGEPIDPWDRYCRHCGTEVQR